MYIFIHVKFISILNILRNTKNAYKLNIKNLIKLFICIYMYL